MPHLCVQKRYNLPRKNAFKCEKSERELKNGCGSIMQSMKTNENGTLATQKIIALSIFLSGLFAINVSNSD